ncbi:hypothetical protein OG21DRAFT_1419571, partial [Imleria badia]
VTGHIHHNIQCYLVRIIDSIAPSEVTIAICSLMHFWYPVQAYYISDADICLISASLSDLHINKDAILEHGG